MAEQPLVSIALCTYNGARYLAQQLDTLVDQTYKNIEIVVSDDCSKDDTYAILTEYAKKYPNIHLHRNEVNLGFVNNFKQILQYCKGDLIAFCDQDDLWHLEKIELQVNAIGDNMFIYHDSEFIDEDDQLMNRKISDVLNLYRGNSPEPFLFFNCVSGHAMLIKKELLNHVSSFEGYFHDWWLAYVATNVGSIDFLPQCLVKYRQHSGSDTDMMGIKETDQYRDIKAEEEVKRKEKWLEHCANYSENRDPEFVKTLYKLYTERPNRFFTFKLGKLMKEHVDNIFFIQKRDPELKRRKVDKFMWGLKGKNFWYTYIRPDKKKVLDLTSF